MHNFSLASGTCSCFNYILEREQKMASESPEDPADLFGDDEGEDDLFGDEDEVPAKRERALSDEDLDSGDDENRNDRVPEHIDGSQQVGQEDREARVMDATFPRHVVPKPTDEEACLKSMGSK
jgi:RNA polymerase-associated protein LEO1